MWKFALVILAIIFTGCGGMEDPLDSSLEGKAEFTDGEYYDIKIVATFKNKTIFNSYDMAVSKEETLPDVYITPDSYFGPLSARNLWNSDGYIISEFTKDNDLNPEWAIKRILKKEIHGEVLVFFMDRDGTDIDQPYSDDPDAEKSGDGEMGHCQGEMHLESLNNDFNCTGDVLSMQIVLEKVE